MCPLDCKKTAVVIVKRKRSMIVKAHFSPRVTRRILNNITKEIIAIDIVIGIEIVATDIKKKIDDVRREERRKFVLSR